MAYFIVTPVTTQCYKLYRRPGSTLQNSLSPYHLFLCQRILYIKVRHTTTLVFLQTVSRSALFRTRRMFSASASRNFPNWLVINVGVCCMCARTRGNTVKSGADFCILCRNFMPSSCGTFAPRPDHTQHARVAVHVNCHAPDFPIPNITGWPDS